MDNRRAIRELIKKYKSVLKNTDMDICESVKGRWYFMRYDKEYDVYDKFLEFDTAEELIKILTGELAVDMTLAIGEEPEFPEYSHSDLADDLDFEFDYRKAIAALSVKLDKIIQDDRLSAVEITKLLQLQGLTKEG